MVMRNPFANPFAGLDLLSSSVILLDDGLTVRHINSAAEDLLATGRRMACGSRLERSRQLRVRS